MGRTFEALSQTRVKYEAAKLPPSSPTIRLPSAPSEHDSHSEKNPAIDQALAVTALLDGVTHDDDSVPFVEVGGRRGSQPIYGPLVAMTPAVDPGLLQTRQPFLNAEKAVTDATDWSVAFFPVTDEKPISARHVAAEIIAFHKPEHPVSAQYRTLFAGIGSQHTSQRCPLLVFITATASEAGTPVVLNMAMTCAREENKRILVIEPNQQRQSSSAQLDVSTAPGIRELLNRSIPLPLALKLTLQPRLFILPPGDANLPVTDEAEARLPMLLERLRKRFDWVLIETPEWTGPGIGGWAHLADAVYLIVQRDQWDSLEVETAHDALVQNGAKLKGYISLDRPSRC